jgi:hypothetical protein
VRVAFDNRAVTDPGGIGRYVRCLLEALRETNDDRTIVETHRPRRADVYHSPWLEGAQLRTPCPMVVTVHSVVALKRRSEQLRTGLRSQLRYLAIQRAGRVIVATPTVGTDVHELLGVDLERIIVIPEAAAHTLHRRPAVGVRRCARHGVRGVPAVGQRTPRDPRKRGRARRGARSLPPANRSDHRWAHRRRA